MRELDQALLQGPIHCIALHQGNHLVCLGYKAATEVATLDVRILQLFLRITDSVAAIPLQDAWSSSGVIHFLVEDGHIARVAIGGDSSHYD